VIEQGAGWLCEPEDAANGSWMGDAFWARANGRNAHLTTIRTQTGVAQIADALGRVTRASFLDQLFYGDGDGDRMTGLSPRYSTMDPLQAQNAVCVLDGGGAGETVASAWLIGWGPRTIFIATPDGEPLVGAGEATMVVADWHFAVRVANIGSDVGAADLQRLLTIALHRFPRVGPPDKVRPTFYLNAELSKRLGSERMRDIFVRGAGVRSHEVRVPSVP
jgi:hypothetical protein